MLLDTSPSSTIVDSEWPHCFGKVGSLPLLSLLGLKNPIRKPSAAVAVSGTEPFWPRVSHDGVTADLLSSGSQSNLQSVHFALLRLSKQLGVIESSIAVSFCSEEPRTQPTTSLTMLRRGLAAVCLSLFAALARSQYTPGKFVDALLRSHDVRSRPSIHTFDKHVLPL